MNTVGAACGLLGAPVVVVATTVRAGVGTGPLDVAAPRVTVAITRVVPLVGSGVATRRGRVGSADGSGATIAGRACCGCCTGAWGTGGRTGAGTGVGSGPNVG